MELFNNFENFENIKKRKIDWYWENGDPIDLLEPGILVIHCRKTHRSLLINSSHPLLEARYYVEQLKNGTFENQQLQRDYQLYGKDQFMAVLLAYGPEWEDVNKREQEFKRLESCWLYPFY